MPKISYADSLDLQQFQHNSVLKYALWPEIAKQIHKNRHFGFYFKSFKVIDVGTPGKLISCACYEHTINCLNVYSTNTSIIQ